MVSIKLIAAAVCAFAATVSASHGGHMHRRAAYYSYGKNDTLTTGIMGTGTVTHLEPVVTPTTYMATTTSCVTVTYTLGDGRAITKTITKTIEVPTTAYETHYYSTASVHPTDSETTTVFHYLPSGAPTEKEEEEDLESIYTPSPTDGEEPETIYSTTTHVVTVPVYHTDTKYQTEGSVAKPTNIAPVEYVEQLTTKTVTSTVISTEIAHITKTIAPPAPVYPVASSSSLPVVKLPPYANYTLYTTVKDNKPTTIKLYSTDKAPVVGPTGTGIVGCPVAYTTTITQSVVTTVAGPTSIETVYEYY